MQRAASSNLGSVTYCCLVTTGLAAFYVLCDVISNELSLSYFPRIWLYSIMALRTVSKVFRIRNCSICSRNIFPSLSVYDSQPQVFQQRNYQEGQNRSKEKQHKENGKKWDTRIPIATGFGLSAIAVATGLYHHFENRYTACCGVHMYGWRGRKFS